MINIVKKFFFIFCFIWIPFCVFSQNIVSTNIQGIDCNNSQGYIQIDTDTITPFYSWYFFDNQSFAWIGYSSEGRLLHSRLHVVEEDKNLLPTYIPSPIVKEAVLRRYPVIETVLSKLKGKISLEKIQLMNYEVEIEEHNVYDVVQKFLLKEMKK